jgi:hypothetical protein
MTAVAACSMNVAERLYDMEEDHEPGETAPFGEAD